MKIGIVGAGNTGSVLAGHFHQLQHTVFIANSRGPETLVQVAEKTGATPVTIAEVANAVDLIVITIPQKGVLSEPENLMAKLPAQSPIVNTGIYYPLRDGILSEIRDGMVESEWTSQVLGRPVIKAFNNITADSLQNKSLSKGSRHRIALPVSGGDAREKHLVMRLVDEMGFGALDAGPLSDSWRYQPGTPAYCPDPTTRRLPSLLQRADRKKAPANRDNAAKTMAKLPADFPQQELVRVARLSAGLDTLKPRSWFAILRLGFAVLMPAAARTSRIADQS